ncbi:debranching enzyme-associated ribonuclease, putative [Plasmodium berghei]|uniref:Debranching enzyme-associated ribonuclease, putative n=2 Tax=Plasmodium berghei TaxID=5821 RepID=A0A509AUU8_PLABA|nr:debranching enzyme-associated ribonuclease, putative [Plasmodium berghei ANKA]CXJ21319.1 debranching enzyme-associated ribonuclease, putative [Plasmodium berghei]SCM26591.1 debranching enzyme-associated ribonuclease, putative [Plasmodium berghei]SCN28536.1 debranching enzyme-associated ribonuclease, putative [Plasmodium berghei]SCO62725.1 debranching enzyme-associated ribonuclease, putative [Plasmodium berghei]SCO64285.1 debranching enzyme-associated ribonuclease, putative [Plasmodium bergh|eukprot:XP_034424181.1 debranching enzyme-associated ribonuclease, putative [Plasmodium berghei ANKA]
MSDVDDFYEYAKNNFLNLLKKNNLNPKNPDQKQKQKNDLDTFKEGKNSSLLYQNELKIKKKKKKRHHNNDDDYSREHKKSKDKYKKDKKKKKSKYSGDECNKKHKNSKHEKKKKKKKHHKHEESDDYSDILWSKKKKEKEREQASESDSKISNSSSSTNKNNFENDTKSSSSSIAINKNAFESDEDNKMTKSIINTDDSKNVKTDYKNSMENIKLAKKLEKKIYEQKEKILLKNALNKKLVDCKYCIDSDLFQKVNKLNIISISDKSYICYYNYKNVFLKNQLFISPIEHTISVTNTDFETILDMRNHMKSLIAMLEEYNQTCIFIEFNNCFNTNIELISMRKTKHTYVNCYSIPMNLLEKAKIYFKKNLQDISSLYRENKQLIITDNKYAPYGVIPKNIPYVSVNFSLVETYIQVIENNYDYINMCRCIFTDIFKQDRLYKYFKNFQMYVDTVEEFKTIYAKYDWANYR